MDRDLARLRDSLERSVVGLDDAKRRILERAALRATTGARAPALLFAGPPGTGKDAVLAAASEALGRPIPRVAIEAAADRPARRAAAEEAIALARREPLAVATAHHPSDVPEDLAHRFELVRMHGYARAEKLEIARRALLPRARRSLGPLGEAVDVTDAALARLARDYSPEAGVHELDRRVCEVVRRAAAGIAIGEVRAARVDEADLPRLLGPAPADPHGRDGDDARAARGAEVGAAMGLAWTRAGSEPVLVEALRTPDALALRPRSPDLAAAVEAALAYIRARADLLRIDPSGLSAAEVAVRATGPAAVPEDAGLDLPILLALVSLASDRPVRADVAATGAVTLRGAILPVAGVPEKVLAAERAGLRKALVPRANFAAVEAAIPAATLAALEVVPVRHADDAVRHALIDIVIARGIA
jgi:ATP-dependent Lon protease